MTRDGVEPDLKLCNMLCQLLPNTTDWDEKLVAFLDAHKIQPDTEFFNSLIYRRVSRHDSFLALVHMHMTWLLRESSEMRYNYCIIRQCWTILSVETCNQTCGLLAHWQTRARKANKASLFCEICRHELPYYCFCIFMRLKLHCRICT